MLVLTLIRLIFPLFKGSQAIRKKSFGRGDGISLGFGLAFKKEELRKELYFLQHLHHAYTIFIRSKEEEGEEAQHAISLKEGEFIDHLLGKVARLHQSTLNLYYIFFTLFIYFFNSL